MWLVLIILLSPLSWATPEDFEVWFLTPPTSTLNLKIIQPHFKYSNFTAEATCEQIGDFCLDAKNGTLTPKIRPQFEPEKVDVPYESLPQLPTASSLDRKLVNCEQAQMFDIFCGKATDSEIKAQGKLEIWLDISSSMRSVDGGEDCNRKKFIQALMGACDKSKPKLMGFDVEIRDISVSESCINRGLNDAKKMMKWIEESKANKLILITDVYEYQNEFAAFLSEKNAKIKGDRGYFPSVQLMDHISHLAKWCE